MVAISGAFVLIAAALAAWRVLWLARVSNKRAKQPVEFAQISEIPPRIDNRSVR